MKLRESKPGQRVEMVDPDTPFSISIAEMRFLLIDYRSSIRNTVWTECYLHPSNQIRHSALDSKLETRYAVPCSPLGEF